MGEQAGACMFVLCPLWLPNKEARKAPLEPAFSCALSILGIQHAPLNRELVYGTVYGDKVQWKLSLCMDGAALLSVQQLFSFAAAVWMYVVSRRLPSAASALRVCLVQLHPVGLSMPVR